MLSTSPPTASASDLLGPGGPLAQRMPGYEVRPGQLAMARAVEAVLSRGGILLVEAGTGTGKTLAYLVPAILSGKKVVVSTATRALQDQIVLHDLPLIREELGLGVRLAVMKGLGNYLCLRRHQEALAGPGTQDSAHQLGLIATWLGETLTGDLSELAKLEEDDPIRAEVASASDTRLGPPCKFFEECFVTRMRREAEAADLVVVNHHLFFADLSLRGAHPARVIPDYQVVIFDEAHQLEEIATSFFGVRVSRATCERLLRDARRALGHAGQLDALFTGTRGKQALGDFEHACASFWSALGNDFKADGRIPFDQNQWVGDLARRYYALDAALEGLSACTRASSEEGAETLELIGRRATALREELSLIVDGTAGQVTWLEPDARNPALGASPVALADLFRQRIFDHIPGAILTSATLSGGSTRLSPEELPELETRFGYLRSRLGLETAEPRELVVPSPFDFPGAALFYTPADLPDPNQPGFLPVALERVAELVRMTPGGAFVLTTSMRSLREFARGLGRCLPEVPLLVQGRAPKAALLADFRRAQNAVLVATMSFWEGVDVPGEALRLVVLEKIPFLVPTDPVVVARARELEAHGRDPFFDLLVPEAAITLKQGFGRLIRSRTDRGVVALLDGRVLRRGYGKRLLRDLPPATRTTELEAVRRFWAEAGADR